MPQGQGYTLDELKAMGKVSKDYQPPAQVSPATERKGYTLQELQDMGKVSKSYVPPAPEPISAPEPSMGLGEKILRGGADIAIGAAKGLATIPFQMQGLADRGVQAIQKATGIGYDPNFDLVKKGEEFSKPLVTPTNAMQKVGKFAEQTAELLTPTGLEGVAAKVGGGILKAMPKARVSAGLLSKVPKMVAEGVEFGGKTLAQTGDVEEAKSAGLIGAATSPVLGAAGKILRGAGGIAAQALGKTTGAGEAAIKEAFSNPSVVKYARQGTDAISSLQEQALEGAKRGLSNMAKKRGSDYVKALERIKTDPTSMREIADNAIMQAQDFLSEAGVKVGKGKMLPRNAFKDSAIEQGKTAVEKAYRTLTTWTDHSAAGLDKLKKKLNQFKNSVRNTTDGSYAAIKSMSSSVDNGLKTMVHGYGEMTSKYAAASDVLDEIEKALSLKDSASKETAIRKFMSTMRQNNEMRLEFLKELGAKGGGDIVGKVAGSTMAPWMPRGLSGTYSGPISLGAITTGNIPGYLAYLAGTSPRLVAEAVSILGKTSGKLLTEETKKALRAILIQASREKPEND